MGTPTLIYIIGALLAFVIVNNNILKVTSDQSTLAIGRFKTLEARNGSNSLQSMIASQVSSNLTYRSSAFTTLNMLSGSASYRVVDTTIILENFVKVEVVSAFNGENSKVVSLYRAPMAYSGIPTTAFTYAVSCGGNGSINGNVYVHPSNPEEDADIRMNGDCHMNRNKKIHGHIHHQGNFDGDENDCGSDHGDGFVKDHDGSEAAHQAGINVQHDTPIKVPDFNSDNCKAKATKIYLGDKTISSGNDFTLGTVDHPVIIYIGGNLTLRDNCSITGYGTIIVKGQINIGDCDFNTRVRGAFMCYSEGDINMDGSNHYDNGNHYAYGHGRAECHGHFFSKRKIHIKNMDLHGCLASGNDMDTDDNSDIYYKPAPDKTTITSTVPITTTSGSTSSARLVLYRHYE